MWLLKGKQDKSAAAMKSSLDYSCRALAIAPAQIHFKFNIAFVQIQLAQLLYGLPESQRILPEVQAAAEGLDAAIESFTAIAQSPNPPYPKHDIEQRANMGRNTMRRQLERAVQSQREYEERNAAKLQEAREAREAELRRKEEEKVRAAQIAVEQKRKITEERYKMLEVSRELAERRAEEERRKEEALYTDDEETGERVKRKKVKKEREKEKGGKRKKKGDETETDEGPRRRGKSTAEDDSDSVAADRAPNKKKRKLSRFKSSEIVVDTSTDDEGTREPSAKTMNGPSATITKKEGRDMDIEMDDLLGDDEEEEEGEEEAISQAVRKKVSRRIADDDDEDEDEGLTFPVPQEPSKKSSKGEGRDSADDDSVFGGNGLAEGDDDEPMANDAEDEE